MEYRTLHIAKVLLFRLFWVQLAFLLLAWTLYSLGKDTFYPWILLQTGIRIHPEELTHWILLFFGLGKFILYCVYLVPAIAIHWTLRSLPRESL
ncbi:MAG: hypothetical protein K0Q50_2856 [Vampirovibrio sp.]|jgi:hypothetical protein|nr:hypothetical protein [Vampirovibrio sp.]